MSWKYPSIERVEDIYPHPSVVFRQSTWWCKKYDGSCLSVWLDDDNNVRISSRNIIDASDDIKSAMLRTDEYPKIVELLKNNPSFILFGELLMMGRSPARFELHEKEEFIGFDIIDKNLIDPSSIKHPTGWMSIPLAYQYYYQYGIKTPELIIETDEKTINTMDELYQMCDHAKARAIELNIEGLVGKTTNGQFRWKVKTDRPTPLERFEKNQASEEILPPLPDSEAFGAVDKVFVDIGFPDFDNPSIAMPKIAAYIEREMVNHRYGKPRLNFFYYFSEYKKDKKGEN